MAHFPLTSRTSAAIFALQISPVVLGRFAFCLSYVGVWGRVQVVVAPLDILVLPSLVGALWFPYSHFDLVSSLWAFL